MKKVHFFILIIIIFSYSNSKIKNKSLAHGKDCTSDIDCGKGLSCILYRCMTDFEKNNINLLGLNDKNICPNNDKCPSNKECINHRCIENLAINNKNNINEQATNLLFTGSILLDKRAFKSGERGKDKYDYKHIFTHITKKIKSADLPITSLETIFYMKDDINDLNFPLKINNTPKELGDALAYAGFRLILHASPFSFNLKEKGIINTLNFWEANYPFIKILGISRNEQESENNYFIYKSGKINIGIINFSAFKSDKIRDEKKYMINFLSKGNLGKIMEKIKNITDFNIVCINWGKKYGKFPDKKQINITKKLADFGIDLIIGNYPYNVEPVSYIKSEKGNKALVFWSLGLLLGDTDKNKNYTLGAMADIKLKKLNGKTFVWKYKMIPIVNHISEDKQYSIYELEDYKNVIGKNIISKDECENIFGIFSKC